VKDLRFYSGYKLTNYPAMAASTDMTLLDQKQGQVVTTITVAGISAVFLSSQSQQPTPVF